MIVYIIIFIVILIPIYSYNKNRFTIRKGTHSALLELCPHLGTTRMSRTLIFDKNCLYEDTSGEEDWNKAFGFSYGNHHTTSFRIGWRCREGVIETCLYYYMNGVRNFKHLKNVRPGTPNKFIIVAGRNRVEVVYGNRISGYNAMNVKGLTSLKPKPGYYLYPYFGGQAKAPHKMKLRIFK